MKPSDFLTELSNDKLTQYKTAAAADASKADKEGDFKKGDKRFSGIVKATKKQFDNDAKKDVAEGLSEPTRKVFFKVIKTQGTGMPSGYRRVKTMRPLEDGGFYIELSTPGYGMDYTRHNYKNFSLKDDQGKPITGHEANNIINGEQGVAEGSNNDYQQGVDDGVEYFLYTDGEGDTIKDVFLQMKRSATEPKSKKYWRGVVDGMKSVQSEEQVEKGVAEGSETAADIDKKIEFHKQGQAAAQYKGSMNKMHAAKIRELEAKKQVLKQGVAEGQGSIVDKCASLAAKYFNSAGLQQQYDIDEFIKINTGDNVVVDKCASLAAKYFNSAGLQQQYDIGEYIKANVKQGVAEGDSPKVTTDQLKKMLTHPALTDKDKRLILQRLAATKPKQGVAEADIIGFRRSADAISKQKVWQSSAASDSKQDDKTFSYQGYTINFTPDKLNIYLGGDLVLSRKGNFANPTKMQLVAARGNIGKIIDDKRRAALIRSVIQKNKGIQGVAEGSTETPQQQQVRAAITKGMEKWDQNGLATYQSQPAKRNYFASSDWASGQLKGINSIDPDGTVVIELNDTTTAGLVKKLAALGGVPGVKTRQLKMMFDPAKTNADGVTRGDVAEDWSQKYKSSINCSHPKGFSQKAHCAGKKKHNESIEMEMVCEDCGMCETHSDHENLDEACWKGYHKEGNKKMFGKTYPNCVKNTNEEQEQHSDSCPHCGGEMVSEELINEKKDACYYKVKSRYKVWPSAYASGALVKCRKKGADSWGNGSKNESSILEGIEQADESLHDWFNKEKWVRMDTKGNIKGPCAKEPGEGKPKCLPQAKAHSLGKKGRASAAARKRREDPNPERSGKAINVNTKKTKG